MQTTPFDIVPKDAVIITRRGVDKIGRRDARGQGKIWDHQAQANDPKAHQICFSGI